MQQVEERQACCRPVGTTESLRPAFGEQVAGCDDAGRREAVEAAAGLVRFGVLLLSPARDPAGVFEPVHGAVDGGPRPLRRLRDRPAGTDLTVHALAARAGYRDVSYFVRSFKRRHGLTPADWRRAGHP
jgi:AraC-like DNA-binding protein